MFVVCDSYLNINKVFRILEYRVFMIKQYFLNNT